MFHYIFYKTILKLQKFKIKIYFLLISKLNVSKVLNIILILNFKKSKEWTKNVKKKDKVTLETNYK